jgi:hypothetical protein
MKSLLKAKYVFPLIFFGSFFIFLTHLAFTKTALYSDSRFYYSYTVSWVKDHDIRINEELLKLTAEEPSVNKSGLAVNTFPPGVSILWIPSFWLADNFAKSVNLFGEYLDDSGYGINYQTEVATASILLMTLGLYLVYRMLSEYFSEKISLLSSITLFTTTNLLFYGAMEPLMTHSISFFTSALFIYYFQKHIRNKNSYLVLGFLAGIAGLVRALNSFLILIPFFELLTDTKRGLKEKVTNNLKLALGYLMGFFPQIYLWKLFFNEYIIGPSWGYGFDFKNPQIIHVLFNTQNGLLTLTPISFIAFLGTILFWKKGKKLAFYGISYFILQLYLISSWAEFTQGGSYSIRMLVNTYPLLSFGLAEILKRYQDGFGETKTILTISALSAINAFLIVRYLLIY